MTDGSLAITFIGGSASLFSADYLRSLILTMAPKAPIRLPVCRIHYSWRAGDFVWVGCEILRCFNYVRICEGKKKECDASVQAMCLHEYDIIL